MSRIKRVSLKKAQWNKLDRAYQDLFREICWKFDIRCEVSGEKMDLCHHFYEKHQSANLQYDIENFIPVTSKVHTAHHRGGYHVDAKVVLKRGQEWFDRLEKKKQTIVKRDFILFEIKSAMLDWYKQNKNILARNYKKFGYFTLNTI